MQAQAAKPPLYRGFPIPIHALSPSAFEDFTYQALSFLGKKLGFEMTSGRQSSNDQGYDCTAKSHITNYLICIQCKRYESALSLKTAAEEVIKVSLDKALNGSDIKHHYIITTGTVSGALRKATRQSNYADLKGECEKIIAKGNFLPALLESAKKKGLDCALIAKEYLDTLENLTIWSGIDFHNELITVWGELSDILEYNFSIDRILRDNPTPDFDLKAYLKKISLGEKNLTPLNYLSAPLPSSLTSPKDLLDFGGRVLTTDNILELLKSGKNIAICSPGGSGKSSTLSLIAQELTAFHSDIEYLPVKLKLRSYSRNMLSQMIERELDIGFGSWKSLPFKFFFLLDGLDEMLQCDTQAFFDDLAGTLDHYNYIVTLRDKGLGIETCSKTVDSCLSIQPLSYRSAFNIASAIFKSNELDEFYEQYRSRLSSVEFDFFASPFVLSRSIEYYKKNKKLPMSTEEILEDWISSKLKIDSSRVVDSDVKINKLPESQVIQAFSTVLYKANFEYGVSSIPEESYVDLMIACHDELVASSPYLSKLLNFEDFLNLIAGYEILYKGNDGHFSTPHLIISDYLASKALSKNWRKHQDSEFSMSQYDIWLYCSNFVASHERADFLKTVFGFDIALGAKVACRFQGELLNDIENKLLHLEASEKILTRSKAIYALGILKTENSLSRLKSNYGYVDSHHPYQRRRALALSGDHATLVEILIENESRAQLPAQISGGDYDLWFRCPPTVITTIARDRINAWRMNRHPELCMSLRTLAMFGDSSDCEILLYVLEHTDYSKEFYDAANALLEIDRALATATLIRISNEEIQAFYWAKKALASIGAEFNIDKEFDFFIELSKNDEAYLANEETAHTARNIVELLKNAKLDSQKIDTLISMYQGLTFRNDLYYYTLVWSLGLRGSPGCLLPLVRLAYSKKDPTEINHAIWYLSQSSDIDMDEHLAREVDDYFECLNGRYEGIFRNYVTYYSKNKPREFILELMRKKTSDLLLGLTPDSISINDYNVDSIFKYDLLFDFFSLCTDDETCITQEDSYKLLLVNTDHSNNKIKLAKLRILNRLAKTDLDNYLKGVRDSAVRARIVSYMLTNDLSSVPLLLAEEYFSIFLSHNFYYQAIVCVCAIHWDDRLAKLFLTEFCHFDWDPNLAQLFEQHTDLFLKLLTKKQLEEFEEARSESVNEFVERTYRVFLESRNLAMK